MRHPLLTMPCTQSILSLHLCWPESKTKVACIEICETDDKNIFSNFFFALKLAVTEFRNFTTKKSFVVEPFQAITFDSNHNLKKPHVYCKDEKVYKFYDTFNTPNRIDIIKEFNEQYLPGLDVIYMSDDKRYQCLMYKYIEVKESTDLQLSDFLPIMRTLNILHELDYVHSDVRLVNFLFPMDDSEAKLIDFDWCDKVNTGYPNGYNTDYEERHPNAKFQCTRQIVHDQYSLLSIIKSNVDCTDEVTDMIEKFLRNQQPELWKELVDILL